MATSTANSIKDTFKGETTPQLRETAKAAIGDFLHLTNGFARFAAEAAACFGATDQYGEDAIADTAETVIAALTALSDPETAVAFRAQMSGTQYADFTALLSRLLRLFHYSATSDGIVAVFDRVRFEYLNTNSDEADRIHYSTLIREYQAKAASKQSAGE